MKYNSLGATGVSVSAIAFGCGPKAGLMVKGSAEERRRAVARALELGITLFDTASIYGDGLSETHLGETLKELKATPIIGSKVALETPDLKDIKGTVIRSVEDSLKRLQVESIELIQLHNRVGSQRADRSDMGVGAQLTVDDVLGDGGVLDAFETLRQQGKVNWFGFTALGGQLPCVYELIDSGKFHSINGGYNVLNPSAMDARTEPQVDRDFGEVFKRSAAKDMGVIVIRVLAAGILAGSEPNAGAERVKGLLAAQGVSPVEGAVRFVLSSPKVSTAVIGFSELAHIEEAVAASNNGVLPADLVQELEAVTLTP
jgi:aryl-alcohol dehydrogenase-like predicted oxidoreductase